MRNRPVRAFAVCLIVGASLAPLRVGAQAGDTPTTLEVGKPVDVGLKGGESHVYMLELQTNEIVDTVVDQRGIDVVVVVLDPDGKKIAEVDSTNGSNGPEPVQVVARRAGTFRVEVRALKATAASGRYEARVTNRRIATERELDLIEASRLLRQAKGYRERQMVKEGVPLAERALELREKHLGPDHPDVALALTACADILLLGNDDKRSEPLLQRALAIYEKAFGPEHPDIVVPLTLQAGIEMARDHDAEADALIQRALAIAKKAERLDLLIHVTNLLAIRATERGELAKALAYKLDILAMREKLLGPDHPDLMISYGQLGSTYSNMRDYENGERMFRRAVEIGEKSLGPNHPAVATNLSNLAFACTKQGKLVEAESLLVRALAIGEKAWGPESEQVVAYLHNLGMLCLQRRELDQAERYFSRELATVEKAPWRTNRALRFPLNGLGVVAVERGDLDRAEVFFRREMEIYDLDAPTGDVVVGAATRLAVLAWHRGAADEALPLFERADETREHNVSRQLTVGSERQKRGYVAALTNDAVLAFVARAGAGSPRAARLALSVALRRKGRSLDETADTIGTLRKGASPEDRALLDELAEARARLTDLALKRARSGEGAGIGDEIAKLTRRADEVETQLGLRDPRLHLQALPITVDRIRAALPEGAALVEFVRFDASEPWRRTPDHHYAALVVRRDGDPTFTDLGPASSIDADATAFRRDAANPASTNLGDTARKLGARLLGPISQQIRGAKRLLVSPDGQLNLIPFAALADERGTYFVEHYEISYLTSGRDLLRLGERVRSSQPAIILADPDFQADTGAEAAADPARTRAVNLANPKFLPLPGTEEEARAVGRLIAGSVMLTRGRATKAALVGARAPWLLHVATHGFFVPDAPVANAASIEDPLLRSGLALAGANRRDGGHADGLLMALEVSGLDLWGTQLVVLSACDTGLGDVRSGEGVYGLRRALVLAGSETQVLSLWNVDDLATRDLMKGYYTALLAGAGRAEALRTVQLKMLTSSRRKHPAFWAGFIVSGDWRPLTTPK